MPFGTKRDQLASPGPRQPFTEFQSAIRIIRAGHKDAGKSQRLPGHRRKPLRRLWKYFPRRIWRRDQQSALNFELCPGRPVSDLQTSQAVRHKNRPGTRLAHSRFEGLYPVPAQRMVPVLFGHSTVFRMRLFPERLPVLWPRVVDARKDQDLDTQLILRQPPGPLSLSRRLP